MPGLTFLTIMGSGGRVSNERPTLPTSRPARYSGRIEACFSVGWQASPSRSPAEESLDGPSVDSRARLNLTICSANARCSTTSCPKIRSNPALASITACSSPCELRNPASSLFAPNDLRDELRLDLALPVSFAAAGEMADGPGQHDLCEAASAAACACTVASGSESPGLLLHEGSTASTSSSSTVAMMHNQSGQFLHQCASPAFASRYPAAGVQHHTRQGVDRGGPTYGSSCHTVARPEEHPSHLRNNARRIS
eukprot:CAMPEP_0179024268 /NCGR_PEP_ID=MMETSP0796-20121207/7367_1 /TAXON_ID=73915 /ORGANISM="Pyrodinium bahamense, Strain pbaha01" /LENGTH=252 /DNA_ID=CAMNT_0020720223 /DNA_START=151 /DNA_END=908 /DNA_ORIENTATION=+